MNLRIITKNNAADPEIGFLAKSISKSNDYATAMPTAWELINESIFCDKIYIFQDQSSLTHSKISRLMKTFLFSKNCFVSKLFSNRILFRIEKLHRNCIFEPKFDFTSRNFISAKKNFSSRNFMSDLVFTRNFNPNFVL